MGGRSRFNAANACNSSYLPMRNLLTANPLHFPWRGTGCPADLAKRVMLTLEYLVDLLEKNRDAAKARIKEFSIGERHFEFNSHPAVMGVINLSPDSWYRESVCLTTQSAIKRGKVLQSQGADIVDVGAESTLAHAALNDQQTQNSKLLPVIKELRASGVLVSVETY